MSDKKQTKTPTILTLTLPDPGGEGTLLIQRGELAHVRQFVYTRVNDIAEAVQAAMDALVLIESNPPVIHDVPPAKTATKAAPPPEPDQPKEPTIDIPVKKGKVAIPVSYLKVTNGDPGTDVYQQAVIIAGRLIDGKLWDGKCHICITDVDAAQGKLKHLSDKEIGLFTLDDFAQRVADEEPDPMQDVMHDLPDTTDDTDDEGELPQDTPDDEPAQAIPTLAVETNQPGLL